MPYQRVTLSNFQSFVLGRIQNSSFYSTREITDSINESIRIAQIATGFWTNRFVLTTVAKRAFYSLSTITTSGVPQVLMPVRLAFNSIPLDPSSLADMDAGFIGWQFQTTTTPDVPDQPLTWGPVGIGKIFIWPADDAGQNSLQIDCMTRAPVLTTSASFLDIDDTFIPPMLDYIVHQLTFKRGGQPFAATQSGLQSYMKALALRNDHLRICEPFRDLMGEDAHRRLRPRRAKDITGRTETIGVRS